MHLHSLMGEWIKSQEGTAGEPPKERTDTPMEIRIDLTNVCNAKQPSDKDTQENYNDNLSTAEEFDDHIDTVDKANATGSQGDMKEINSASRLDTLTGVETEANLNKNKPENHDDDNTTSPDVECKHFTENVNSSKCDTYPKHFPEVGVKQLLHNR